MPYPPKSSKKDSLENTKRRLVEKIENSTDPIDTILNKYKTGNSEIKRFLLDTYLIQYPDLLYYALNQEFKNQRDLVFEVISNKANKISQNYFDEIFERIKSPILNYHLRKQLLNVLLKIMERNHKLFEYNIKNVMNFSINYVLLNDDNPYVLQTIFQMIKNDENLVSFFIKRLIASNKNLRKNPNEVTHLLQKLWNYLDLTKIPNILATLSDDPKGQIFILNSLPNSPKYLNVFIYLSRSKNKRVSELAKEKIKNLKD